MTKTRAAKLRSKNSTRIVEVQVQRNRPRIPRNVSRFGRGRDFQISPEFQYFGNKPKAQGYLPIPPRNQGLYAQRVKVPMAGGNIINRNAVQPFIQTLNRSSLVTNTEMFLDVNNLAPSVDNRYHMIPGNFSWLDNMAENFSKWQWRYLRFIYIPFCATTTAGTIIMSPGYDAYDNLATAEVQLQQAFRSVTAPVWAGWEGSSALHQYGDVLPVGSVAIEIDVTEFKSGNELTKFPYISIGNFTALASTNKMAYTPGYLDVWYHGGDTGKIFAQYQIELFEPVNPTVNTD